MALPVVAIVLALSLAVAVPLTAFIVLRGCNQLAEGFQKHITETATVGGQPRESVVSSQQWRLEQEAKDKEAKREVFQKRAIARPEQAFS